MKNILIKGLLSVTIVLLLMGIVFAGEMSDDDALNNCENICGDSENTCIADCANVLPSSNNIDKKVDNNMSSTSVKNSAESKTESKTGTNLYIYPRSRDKKDTTIKVSGKLLNNTTGIKGENISIKVNNKTYCATSGGYGYFTVNHTITSYDDLNVTYTYAGSSKYLPSTNSTVYTVKKPTTIQAYKLENTAYTSKIQIGGKLLSDEKVIKGEVVTININNKGYKAITDEEGVFNINYTANTPGINNVTYNYGGSSSYIASNTSTTFTTLAKKTRISLDKINSVEYTDYITITGKYVDIDNNPLTYTPITITINNEKYVNKTDSTGTYTYHYKTRNVGTNNITTSYHGNTRYAAATTKNTFNVNKKTTKITLNKINTTEYTDYITVSGKYVDTSGNNLTYTPLDINYNNKKYVVYTDAYGNYNTKIRTSKVGINELNVSYHGNARYNAAKESVKFNVTPKSTRVDVTSSISVNGLLSLKGKFVDTGGRNLTFTPMNLVISYESIYTKQSTLFKRVVYTDGNGFFNYSCKVNDTGVYSSKVSYNGNSRYRANSSGASSRFYGESHVFANSIQGIVNKSTSFEVNITDELNNSITSGNIALYLNNKLLENKKVSSSRNTFNIPGQGVGVYDLKISYSSNEYKGSSKLVKLTINPVSNYSIKLIWNPAITTKKQTKISGHIRSNISKNTLSSGQARFYLNNKYIGSCNVKNNLSYVRFNVSEAGGDYTARVDYYRDNKFIGSDSQIVHVRSQDAQVKQENFITLASDLVSNSKITSSKKDVYFAMDRTTHDTSNYSPNDMKIMNAISNNLRANGFNVKTVRNGPGETYNTARYMYNNNIRNSICFILCNGVDANVIREYLKGNDGLLTTVRNRGNDIVLGWFYGAGNIYDPDAEYYYYLQKAWDDNYSGKGGISNPRRTMERDGIKIIYERNDLTGASVADSFIKLYGGTVTWKVKKNSTVSLKTNLYNVNNKNISGGNIVYTINDHVIGNVSVKGSSYAFTYRLPDVAGTYHIKATYYLNNKVVCQSYDRCINVY